MITNNHGAELILSPQSTGINRTRFLTLFQENIQVLCASSSCSHTDPVEESGHRCGCCALKYHGSGTCNLVPFSEVVTEESFTPGMLYWYGKRMYAQYHNDLDSCSLMVCDYCVDRIKKEIAADTIRYSDDDGDASPSKKTKTIPASSQGGDACDRHFTQNNESMKCLVVMCVGQTNEENVPLIELDKDPWKKLSKTKLKPTNPDYMDEVLRRYKTYSADADGGKNTGPRPRPNGWKQGRLLKWLTDNPITREDDVDFLRKKVEDRKRVAINAATHKEKTDKYLVGAWTGQEPLLRLIHALVEKDETKMLYLGRRDISTDRHVLDSRNSIEHRATTVWEKIAATWNDPNFNPVTEIHVDLHSSFYNEIELAYDKIAHLHSATPEYVEKRFQGIIIDIKRGIAKWEKSGSGDGAPVGDDDGDEVEMGNPMFGSITDRPDAALSTRGSFFDYTKAYVLYAWEMLDKHGLLQSSFQVLNEDQSSGDGAFGVPDILYQVKANRGYTDGRSSQDEMSQDSLSAAKKKTTNSAMDGLKNLSDSLKDMSKSSERVAKINADSAELQNLRTTIEALSSRRMTLMLAKITHSGNIDAVSLIEGEMDTINTTLDGYMVELNSRTGTPQRRGRTPPSAAR